MEKKAIEAKGKAAPTESAKSVWISAHSKFQMGKSMMSEEELTSAGVNTRALHKHYINHAMNSNDNNPSIMGEFKAQHLHSGPGFFSIVWSDLYNLFNLDVLDISLIHCLTLWVYIA